MIAPRLRSVDRSRCSAKTQEPTRAGWGGKEMNGKGVAGAPDRHPDAAVDLRPYGPSSTPEEVAAIRRRVSWVADGIVLLHEIPIQTQFSVGVMFDELESLIAPCDRLHYLVDLTD